MFWQSRVVAFTTSPAESRNPESKHSSEPYLDSAADLDTKPIYSNDYFCSVWKLAAKTQRCI